MGVGLGEDGGVNMIEIYCRKFSKLNENIILKIKYIKSSVSEYLSIILY